MNLAKYALYSTHHHPTTPVTPSHLQKQNLPVKKLQGNPEYMLCTTIRPPKNTCCGLTTTAHGGNIQLQGIFFSSCIPQGSVLLNCSSSDAMFFCSFLLRPMQHPRTSWCNWPGAVALLALQQHCSYQLSAGPGPSSQLLRLLPQLPLSEPCLSCSSPQP